MKTSYISPLMALVCTSMMISSPAYAEMDAATAKQFEMMQQQIKQLQAQLDEVKKTATSANVTAKKANAKMAASGKATGSVKAMNEPKTGGDSKTGNDSKSVSEVKTAEATTTGGGTVLTNKNDVKLTLGGFTEAAGIYRSRNETADVGSNYTTGIPFPISPNSHLSEFRGTARQSRLSLLAQGNVDASTELDAYIEADFLGSAVTANSNESNSYNPRLRQAFATVDWNDIGTHVLAGQAWSLITMSKKGITPRQENVPLTIDAQYVPGFNWTRNTQVRLTQDFYDKKVWAALSLESPQTLIFNGPNAASGAPTFNNGGGSLLNSTTTYSTDVAPDMIAKLAFDPGYGHYEIYGIGRYFRDRNHFHNSTIMGGGAGAAAILPIIDKKLDFQISGLAGSGIGRYGSAQLPDVTIKPDGGLAAVQSFDILAGLIGHPTEHWDLFMYGGREQARKKAYASGGNGFGYGSGLYDNTGCNTEGAALTTCVANTSAVSQITGGLWWKFYKGNFGTMQLGAQDSFTKRDTFSGHGVSPSTNENIAFVSLRYYPF